MSLRQTTQLLGEFEYPASAAEIKASYGDHELSLPNGAESLASVLDRSGEERFDNALEAQLAVYGAVSDQAVGRIGYSDRDPDPMGTTSTEPVSF